MVKRWNDWFKLMGPSITTPPAIGPRNSSSTNRGLQAGTQAERCGWVEGNLRA